MKILLSIMMAAALWGVPISEALEFNILVMPPADKVGSGPGQMLEHRQYLNGTHNPPVTTGYSFANVGDEELAWLDVYLYLENDTERTVDIYLAGLSPDRPGQTGVPSFNRTLLVFTLNSEKPFPSVFDKYVFMSYLVKTKPLSQGGGMWPDGYVLDENGNPTYEEDLFFKMDMTAPLYDCHILPGTTMTVCSRDPIPVDENGKPIYNLPPLRPVAAGLTLPAGLSTKKIPGTDLLTGYFKIGTIELTQCHAVGLMECPNPYEDFYVGPYTVGMVVVDSGDTAWATAQVKLATSLNLY